MTATTRAASRLPDVARSFVVPDGTIEALKWLALVLMTLGHVDKYLFAESLPGIFEAGRPTMPIFGFVLAYNLARPGALIRGLYGRSMKRLAIYGLLATPFFVALGGLVYDWWPLNILFTLFVASATMYLIEKGGRARLLAAAGVFLVGGLFVEFWWFGLAYCLAAWWYCKTSQRSALVLWVLVTIGFYVFNKNIWALAALPLIFAASRYDFKIPRSRHIFYAYYPLHLAVLVFLRN